MDNIFLKPTHYCDYNHSSIKRLVSTLAQSAENELQFIEKAFYFVRDKIRFGADIWKVKASGTLKQKYGPCYGKNVLFIALLRSQGIPCALAANPMKRTFTKPSVGVAHLLFSNPFYHCFTEVNIDSKWVHIDPTLDVDNYEAFFKPLNINWNVDWNPSGMVPLYDESIMGESVIYHDIDDALRSNLKSYFIFKFEPDFLLKTWLSIGNNRMWSQMDVGSGRSVTMC